MAQQVIGIGTLADDGTGDSLRVAGQKMNDMFAELYAAISPVILQGTIDVGVVGFASVSTSYTVAGAITSAVKITDGSNQEVITVSFADLGVSTYHVLFEPNSQVDALTDNDTTYAVLNKTSTSFDLSIACLGGDDIIAGITLLRFTL